MAAPYFETNLPVPTYQPVHVLSPLTTAANPGTSRRISRHTRNAAPIIVREEMRHAIASPVVCRLHRLPSSRPPSMCRRRQRPDCRCPATCASAESCAIRGARATAALRRSILCTTATHTLGNLYCAATLVKHNASSSGASAGAKCTANCPALPEQRPLLHPAHLRLHDRARSCGNPTPLQPHHLHTCVEIARQGTRERSLNLNPLTEASLYQQASAQRHSLDIFSSAAGVQFRP